MPHQDPNGAESFMDNGVSKSAGQTSPKRSFIQDGNPEADRSKQEILFELPKQKKGKRNQLGNLFYFSILVLSLKIPFKGFFASQIIQFQPLF
jgi:hypothetical protein